MYVLMLYLLIKNQWVYVSMNDIIFINGVYNIIWNQGWY